MKLSQFDYFLPKKLIAQAPKLPRDSCKLLVLFKKEKKIYSRRFLDINNFLKKGDVFVLNNTKVFPAKLKGKKFSSGGKVELLLVSPQKENLKKIEWKKEWWIILKGKVKIGEKVIFGKNFFGKIIKDYGIEKVIKFNQEGKKLKKLIYSYGRMPLPPYIKAQIPEKKLRKYYQTVYAKKLGSIAAPTAGFHFTKRLMKKLTKKGISFKFITLHISLGTFLPIKSEKIENHKMRTEWAEISKKTSEFLNFAKKEKRRILACGTSVVRALEGFANEKGEIFWGKRNLDLFIFPSYKFKFIDGMLTNFHLPKSPPLLMVTAFCGKDFLFDAYKRAIKEGFNFYSFGDCMLII